MSQKSVFWTTNGTGDGPSAGYTAADFYNFLRRLVITDQESTQGILRGVLNELAVSGSASPLSVASGAAIVYGIYYENTSPVSLAVGIPVNGITGGRVNLKADWTAQTVRAVVQINTDGVSDIPALVQTAGSAWSIPLATFTINPAGQISLASAREYCQFAEYLTADMLDALTGLSVVGRAAGAAGAAAAITAGSDGLVLVRQAGALAFGQVGTVGIADDAVTAAKVADLAISTSKIADAAVTAAKIADDAVDDTKVGERVPQFYRRQGGSSSSWITAGTTNYTPGAVRMQSGVVAVTIGNAAYQGSATVTFPVAFSNSPMIFMTVNSAYSGEMLTCRADAISSSGFTAVGGRMVTGGAYDLTISWLAIGPE